MPLSQTINLVKIYGASLQKGTISDENLIKLLTPGTFTKSSGYVNPDAPVTDSNHSVSNAMYDFVQAIAPSLSQVTLHQLTERLIRLSPEGDKNTFMRGTSLEKIFLSYEMACYPNEANDHFISPRMKKEFSTEQAISNLKRVILSPIVDFFKSAQEQEQLQTNKFRVEKLIALCADYKKHLEVSVKDTELTSVGAKKLNIVNQMLATLHDESADPTTKINNMTAVLSDENKNTLKVRRDSSAGARFLESILNIITLGFISKISKGSAAFWKSHGEVLTDNIDKEQSNAPGR